MPTVDPPFGGVNPRNLEEELRAALDARPDPIDTTLVEPQGPRIDSDDLVAFPRDLPEPAPGDHRGQADDADRSDRREPEDAGDTDDGAGPVDVHDTLGTRLEAFSDTDLLVDERLVDPAITASTGSGAGAAAPDAGDDTHVAGDARTPVVDDLREGVFDRIPRADATEPATPEERDAAERFLSDFGVPGAADLSDAELKAALTEAAEKMRAGAEHDGDLTALPIPGAYESAGAVTGVGGEFRLNADGSITLFTSDGTELKTVEAGQSGGDPRANALQAEFNLPDSSAVPSNATYEKIIDAEAGGGSAIVHVGGAVDIYDADGNVVEHIPPDPFSEIAQTFEEAGEGLSTVGDQIAAIPGTLSDELDQAAEEVGTALGPGGEPEPEDEPGDGSGQGTPRGDAAPATTAGEDEEDDDEGDGDEPDEPAEPAETDAADADGDGEDTPGDDPADDEAGTPLPDDVVDDPAARAAFLDSPLGAQQQRDAERALDLAAGGGLVDPADTAEGGGSGGVVDPSTGTVSPGPLVGTGGDIGPRIDAGGGFAVTDRDLDRLDLLAGGGPAAGPAGGPVDPPTSPSPTPGDPHSPVQPVWFGGGRGPAREGDADTAGSRPFDDAPDTSSTQDRPFDLHAAGDVPHLSSAMESERFDRLDLSADEPRVEEDLSGF